MIKFCTGLLLALAAGMASCLAASAGADAAGNGAAAVTANAASNAPVEQASISPAVSQRQVLVMLHLPPPHFRPDASYSGRYTDDAGHSARRRVAEELARAHGLKLVTDWPMPVLGVDCYVMEETADVPSSRIVELLSRDPRVEWAQPMSLFHGLGRNDPLYPVQPNAKYWHLADIHKVATGRNVLVAVVDSGIEERHPDLAGQVALQENFVDGNPYKPEMHGVEHHSSIDNVDLRYANKLEDAGLIYGFTVHNNPMVQDVYNTGPTWGFPFASSGVAVGPNAATALESLGQQVAGLGAYTLWRNMLYGEVSFYRTADQAFSLLRAGTDKSSDAALKGYNPYWRLALQHEWDDGTQSAMIGTYGMTVKQYPDNTMLGGPTNRFNDIGWDAQYQYITDEHRITGQLNYIHEKQNWDASTQSNPSDTLRSFKAKATYYYQKKYGVNIGYFSTRGNADDALYNSGDPITGSISGSPNSAGTIWELNYLPRRDVRLALQYTAYSRFNGAKNDYDGLGRNAKDNNTLYLLAWLMF